MMHARAALVLLASSLPGALEDTTDPPSVTNPRAVAEVRAGQRARANAAWWGFDPEDATNALQDAISSGAKTVVVPNLGKDWVVRPIQLAGNQELILEPGVVIAAKRGAYRGGGDTVLTASHVDHLTIRGAGAAIRMNKEDYIVGTVLEKLGWQRWFGQYVKAEWRSGLTIRGCEDVSVEGLTIRDTGGDGIMVDGAGDRRWSSNVRLRNLVLHNNYRQGISVISAVGLHVEGCVFRDTWGTPPSSGVDIEPDAADQRTQDIVFRDCRFEHNYGDGIEVFLGNLRKSSADVSIRFEDCRVTSRWGSGIRVTKLHDDGPAGLVTFRDCAIEATEAYGIKAQDISPTRAHVRFERCVVRDTARNREYQGAWAPIWLHATAPDRVKTLGGIEFVDCLVDDPRVRPALVITRGDESIRVADVTGTIRVSGAATTKVDWWEEATGVSLVLRRAEPSGKSSPR